MLINSVSSHWVTKNQSVFSILIASSEPNHPIFTDMFSRGMSMSVACGGIEVAIWSDDESQKRPRDLLTFRPGRPAIWERLWFLKILTLRMEENDRLKKEMQIGIQRVNITSRLSWHRGKCEWGSSSGKRTLGKWFATCKAAARYFSPPQTSRLLPR